MSKTGIIFVSLLYIPLIIWFAMTLGIHQSGEDRESLLDQRITSPY